MTSNKNANEPASASPSASGPAGAQFEGQVGAHYLLTMLAESDPRGLPGVSIERIQMQRAGEGHPLDDVVVHGITRSGERAVLEVQVKRTITFAPNDPVFKNVVDQLAQAMGTLDYTHERRQFAVATERTSFKITGPYQDVLRWAREVESAEVFHARIMRAKVGNDHMRSLVETVRVHLQAASVTVCDEIVWQILRRFHILVFDYDAPGSQSAELAFERARNVLEPAEAARAGALWKALTSTAIRSAASGGQVERSALLQELSGNDGFRLAGAHRNRLPRANLADAAHLAAADLRHNLAGIIMGRSGQLDAVREARDLGRYVEIHGDAGVGKSGLLGMLADQVLSEARAIVLTPERTPAGGWLAFKSELQIEVGIDTFLSDLASDGGAVLFIDSLDFFDDSGKRATVIDLVRAAARIPAFQVIVTARTGFDRDEPNWISADLLALLGRAPPVIIGHLQSDEIEELKAAAPELDALLDAHHPAQAVARNLFRLSRLLEMQGPTDQLRTEIDMIERWWLTADGPQANQRERRRLLVDLSDAILAGKSYLESRAEPSVVEALISSGTLRELSLDRVAFRHDVLREWGVAARLHDAPEQITQLPLSRAAPAWLARGVELGARFALERTADGQAWKTYLARFSQQGTHASWRRWSMLAILRSESAALLLERASVVLLENEGALLQELIRIAYAVESRPLAEVLAKHPALAQAMPAAVFAPSNGSWIWLAEWLLARKTELPLRTLPDVVKLFLNFATAMLLADAMSPRMATALADWLEEIEAAQDIRTRSEDPPRFLLAFRSDELQQLATEIRQAFSFMASRAPERAQSYLRRLIERPNPEFVLREVLKFRGTLPKAAPAELVQLTLTALIPTERGMRQRMYRDDAFTHIDADFLPTSPAQGPFLDLLNEAPAHGLGLIRRLVDHAITVQSEGTGPGADGYTLELPDGARFFPWKHTYTWSRQADGCYAVESGLLALEAWSHVRMERGDPPKEVIADILGPVGSPAAFLLVAVDILISHWPKTIALAVPFLATPELLSVDRLRLSHDGMPGIDLGKWAGIGTSEPLGSVQLNSLKQRLSRHFSLEGLLFTFASHDLPERQKLKTLLSAAAETLGAIESDDTFADVRFMVRFALNNIEPSNWGIRDGKPIYLPPRAEAEHLQALGQQHADRTRDIAVDASIYNAMEDSSQSSPERIENAIAYAQRLQSEDSEVEDALQSRTNAIVSAAMLLTRDGTDAQLLRHEAWARAAFAQVQASSAGRSSRGSREAIRFNPLAIGTLGLVHLWRRHRHEGDRNALLALAGLDDPSAALGFGQSVAIINEFEPRLTPALLRCALVAHVQPIHDWDQIEDARQAALAQHGAQVTAAIQTEIAWLDGYAPEPEWPLLPPGHISVRRPLRLNPVEEQVSPRSCMRPEQRLDSQSAALWIRQLTPSFTTTVPLWGGDFIHAYAGWTADACGAGLDKHAEIENKARDWNGAFLPILARALTRMSVEEAVEHVLRLSDVPDRSFFDIVGQLASAIDVVFFDGQELDAGTAIRLRTVLANRLTETNGWLREHDRSDMRVEMRIGSAIAALFFNNSSGFAPASCYLPRGAIDKLEGFLPLLERLAKSGPVPFTAILVMNVLEVSPRPNHLPFFLRNALSWLQRQPTNTQLWVNFGLGVRLVEWIEAVLLMDRTLQSTVHPEKTQIDEILARLVQVGVAQAHRLEAKIASL